MKTRAIRKSSEAKVSGVVFAVLVGWILVGQGTALDAEEVPCSPNAPAQTIAKSAENLLVFLDEHPKLKDKVDQNDDGTIDKFELKITKEILNHRRQEKSYRGYDHDNNPPGQIGGPGTNLENEPGLQHGPGVNPDPYGYSHRHHHRDYDNNPPGSAGGPGTNWENPSGPQGGSGASPDRSFAPYRR